MSKKKPRHYAPKLPNPALTGVQGAPPALTPQDIGRAANASVDLQTRPTLTALDRQTAQTAVQGKGVQDRIVDLYSNLGKSAQTQLGTFDTSSRLAQGQMAGIGQARQDAITSGYGQAQGRMDADAAVRGGGLDGGASAALASQMAAAHTSAASDQTAASTAQQQTQDAYRGLIESVAAAAPMRGAEMAATAGQKTAGALGDIADKRADVLAQRGGLRAKAISDLTQQAFNNYATVQGLNLKGDAQAINLALGTANLYKGYDQLNENAADNADTTDIAQQNADTAKDRNKIGWANADTAKNKLAWQQRRAQYLDSHGGLAGLTPWQKAQFQKGNAAVRNAIMSVGPTGDAFHQQMVKGADGKQHHYTNEQIHAALLKKFGNDADVVDAGIFLAHHPNSPLPADIEQRLRARHIGIPGKWHTTAQRDTSSNPAGAGK
jgi:hypothetical protein